MLAVQRLKVKLLMYKQSITKLKQPSEELEESLLADRLKTLPSKQRLAVMQCFQAVHRKLARGMKYNPDWLLECIIMRMKSSRLYEHVRKEGILMLPSRTCLKVYIWKYKSGFGFNPGVLAGVAKTKGIDEFKCHGHRQVQVSWRPHCR